MFASTRFALSLVVILAMVFIAPAARAAWPHDPNNGNVALCSAVNSQFSPTVISDGAGGAIVTWYDYRSGTNYDIYAQRVSAAGVPQWTANGVALCTAAGDQYYPMIVSDGAGGAIVTWYDGRGGTNYDIYAQRVNAAGVPQWTADGVALCTAANDQFSPTIASDGAGGAIVTWYDDRSGTNSDIYAQRVNAAGVPQWTSNGVALCTAANNQQNPTIASDGAGGAIVSWQDIRSGTNNDIYVQRVNAAGVAQWTANGVALCTATGDQISPMVISDGAGGAIVTWPDSRSGSNDDIYVQRVNAAGVSQWTGNGVALCTATNSQLSPTIASDGVGGAIVTWYDGRSGNGDIYAQRVNAAGVPQWTADGVALCTAAGSQYYPTIASDGAGGAIVTWEDDRSGTNYDIYAQRVSAAGVPQWTFNGVALSSANSDQSNPTIASDGAGGAIVTWFDFRSGNYDIYSQRIERFGQLGNPEPVSAGVRDVPNDQGGKVSIHWTASYLDVVPGNPLDAYWIWRQVPTGVAENAVKQGQSLFDARAGGGTPRSGALRRTIEGAQIYYWEFVASQAPHGFPGYSFTAATTSDSVAGSNPFTKFMVEAEETYNGVYWSSAPDSGYSVDNLPPVAPAPFTAAYLAGATDLHWGENREPDLAGYRLYRGNSAGFIPSTASLITAEPDTGFNDIGPAGSYYKLSAVDIHGNESVFALVSPGSTAGVSSGGSVAFALYGVWPNPAKVSALNVAFALPNNASARLEMLDMSGRRVAVQEVGALGAGRHAVNLAQGHKVAPGLYWVRLTQGANQRVTRAAVLE